MTPADIAADMGALVIAGCLLSIAVFFLLWAAASALTVARARRRAKRRPELLARLASGCSVSEIAEIDDELDRLLAQER